MMEDVILTKTDDTVGFYLWTRSTAFTSGTILSVKALWESKSRICEQFSPSHLENSILS